MNDDHYEAINDEDEDDDDDASDDDSRWLGGKVGCNWWDPRRFDWRCFELRLTTASSIVSYVDRVCIMRALYAMYINLGVVAQKKNRKKFSDLLNPPRAPPPRFSVFYEQKIYPNFFCWKLHL